MKRKKPTVKQIGEFTLSVYEKVRQLEQIAMGNSQAFLQYLEMPGELDKFNDYLKNKIESKLRHNNIAVKAVCSVSYTLDHYNTTGASDTYHIWRILDTGWGIFFNFEEYDEIPIYKAFP